jgi:predicted metal-dependent hydrolase
MWETIGGVAAAIALAALWYWVRHVAGWPSMKEIQAGTYADHFVYVNDDGSVRELTPEERDYLNTEFHPNDGNRPYIKDRYRDRTPDGKLSGFLLRKRVPRGIPISKN